MLSDLFTWIFTSPRRLLVVGLSAVIIIFVLGNSLLGDDGRASTGTTTGSGGSQSSPSASVTEAAVPESGGYVAAAVNFVRLWAQPEPGESPAEWRTRLTPLATDDYVSDLATTDLDSLPGVQPEGEPVVRFLAQESALIAVPLADASSVLVTVVAGTGATQPLVSDVQPNTGDY